MEQENWSPVFGYESSHEVSDFGRVRSKRRKVFAGKRGKERTSKEIILKPANLNGYLLVNLRFGGKQKTHLVHRLVAKAFLPNPEDLPVVNHKDFDKKNNKVDNLEWCTQKHNNDYTINAGRVKEKPSGFDCKRSIPVEALNEKGEVVAVYGSQRRAAFAMKDKYPKAACCCINQALYRGWKMYGFWWRKMEINR